MARFYSEVSCSSNHSKATNRGFKDLSAHIRGWNVGVLVECDGDGIADDVIRVYETGGTGDSGTRRLIAELQGPTK